MNQDGGSAGRREAYWGALAAASLTALLLLYRPYPGLIHDARVYLGYALAALDPASVGRDLMFARDQQAEFSVFPPLLTVLVRLAGPSTASMGLVLTGLGLWLCAAGALALQVTRGRLAWAALVCALVLPATYGGLAVFNYAEPFMSPRPLAEAGVLGALAALMAGRRILALALMGAAAALHPIMAIPGVATALVLLAVEDRRWIYVAAAGAAAVIVAGSLGLPMADRLFVRIDPDWLGLMRTRNAYLFPGEWAPVDYSRMACQLTALVLAAAQVEGRPRTLLLAVAGVALGGLLTTALLGEAIPSLLITQLQLWRAGWMLAVSGNAALAVAAAGLWRAGGGYRLSLGALILAWLSVDTPWLAAGFAVGALGLAFLVRAHRLPPPSRLVLRLTAAAVAAVALVWAARLGTGLADYLTIGWAAGAPVGWLHVLGVDLARLPVAGAAVALAVIDRPPVWSGRAAAAAALALTALALVAWDSRTPFRRMVDERRDGAELKALMAGAPGEVLWIDGDTEAWMLAGRPNWGVGIQGAGLVFSRALTEEWGPRMRALVGLGLAKPSVLDPFRTLGQAAPSAPGRAGIAALCARPDAPAWIVVGGVAPPGIPYRLWRASAPAYAGYLVAGGYAWRRTAAYAVIGCAQVRGVAPAINGPRP